MDFITGALPNVMFIAGLIAIGIGLGIEFKIVEIKGELSKSGRLAAMGIGAVLVSISVYLYTRPPQTASIPATVAAAQPAVVQANVGAAGAATQAAIVPVTATATSVPPTATAVPPTATPIPPTATAVPPTSTSIPPTATLALTATATAAPPTKPPTPTAAPGVKVPDIRGQSVRDARKMLTAASLQLGESHERCEDIGASETKDKLKTGQIRCQSPVPGSVAVPNTPVLYVLVGRENDHGD